MQLQNSKNPRKGNAFAALRAPTLRGCRILLLALPLAAALNLSGCPNTPSDPNRVGTATCLACHDGRSAPDKREYSKGLHASVDCEDCHGGGLAHVRAGGRNGIFIANPGESPFDNTPALCARCHEAEVAGYQTTGHFTMEAASCNTCHDVHKQGAMSFSTPNHTRLDNVGFARLCGTCHESESKQFLTSTHAVSNVATCGACHNPHTETTFTAPPENNQLCQQCHASFFLGLDTEEAVDAHTGSFHPVEPELTGSSSCIGCHMVPVDRDNQIAGPHDHSFFTVPPAVSNAMIAAGETPQPNSCSGTMGCHDAASPGSGTPFSVDSVDDNAYLQGLYEQIGAISQLGIRP